MQGLILLNPNIYNSAKYLKEIEMLPHPNIQLVDIGLGCFLYLAIVYQLRFPSVLALIGKNIQTLKGQFPLKLKFIMLFHLLNDFILWTTKDVV